LTKTQFAENVKTQFEKPQKLYLKMPKLNEETEKLLFMANFT